MDERLGGIVAKFEHLSKDRELELGTLIQNRVKALEALQKGGLNAADRAKAEADAAAGESAVDELVKANMGLVYDRARAFKSKFPSAPDMEDLVSMGTIGLMIAVHKYDPSRNNKFSTVAYYWIYQSIGREVNNTSRLVRLPENRIADYTRMNAIMAKHEEDGLGPTEMEKVIRDELSLSKADYIRIRSAASIHTSLNRKIGGEGDAGRELMDVVGEEKPQMATEHSVLTNECFRVLGEEIQALDPLKQGILAAEFSFPIGGAYPTSQEIRDQHGISMSKFRRLRAEGLTQIKNSLQSKGLNLADFIEA